MSLGMQIAISISGAHLPRFTSRTWLSQSSCQNLKSPHQCSIGRSKRRASSGFKCHLSSLANLTSRPLSSIGLPYYREPLFSAWPADIISDVGAPPLQLEPSFVATLKQTEWGLYGKNTRNVRRNQVEDTRNTNKQSNALQAPKFLSERARESALSSGGDSSSDPQVDQEPEDPNEIESLKPEAPPLYRNL